MNVFYLDHDPKLAAQYHYDSHVRKMIMEAAQMLSQAYWSFDLHLGSAMFLKGIIYRQAYSTHPCSKWARASIQNFEWLRNLAFELNEENKFRMNHSNNHKSFSLILNMPEPDFLPDIGFTEPAKAFGDFTPKSNNVMEAYREYYKYDKKHLFHYTKRQAPEWLNAN